MASGHSAAFKRVDTILEAMAETVYRLGEECGTGSTVKMINQLLAGVHIAVAAVHEIDLLLTWNCRHIDNPVTKPIIRSVCAVAGFRCPEICTPIEILEVSSDEE